MKRVAAIALTLALAATWSTLASPVLALAHIGPGLYSDDGRDVTKGDINEQDYWWTKFDMMMLDLALRQKQPEGAIGLQLVSTQQRLRELTRKYPKHEELAEWRKKVESVVEKIDPNAPRSASFNPGCPWAESNFAQAWVNYGWAQMQAAANHRDDAIGLLQNVAQNLRLLTEKEGRLKDYPEDLRKWCTDTKPQAEKMLADLKEKRGH